MRRFLTAAGIGLALMASPALANMTTLTTTLNQSNTFADGVDYGSVKVEADDSTGFVKFTVDATTAPYSSIGSNFGFQAFGFNTTPSTLASGLTIVTQPTGWSFNATGGTLDGFGFYLINEDGTGSTRQDPLVFTVKTASNADAVASNFFALSTGIAAQGNAHYAAHLAGFGDTTGLDGSPYSSHFIADGDIVIPAPGAVLLGAMGLGLVGWVRKRVN